MFAVNNYLPLMTLFTFNNNNDDNNNNNFYYYYYYYYYCYLRYTVNNIGSIIFIYR